MTYEPLKKLQRAVRKAERDLDKVAETQAHDDTAMSYRLRELEKAVRYYLAEVHERANPLQP